MCGGASPEDGGTIHIGKMRREKLIFFQSQRMTFEKWRREVSCTLGERNLGRVQMDGEGK